MEPAALITAAVAALALATAAVGTIPLPFDARLAIRIPHRSSLAVVVAVLAASLARPPSARSETPPPAVRLIQVPVPTPPDPAAGVRYTVVAGDCLWRIAAGVIREVRGVEPTSAEIAAYWPSIYDANREVIGDDPNLILVGQELFIPEV